jgi:phosphoglucosamine mutase
MQQAGTLHNDRVIITPMANFGLRTTFDRLGIAYEEADVGDRNVLELMQQRGASLGGEQSGHIIFLDHHTTGDGIISALQLLAVMQRANRPLSELAAVFQRAPQMLINIDVPCKPPLDSIKNLMEAEAGARAELGSEGRTLIRYSGTQPMCRVMVEGPDDEIVARLANELADAVREALC